jgi:hypothetical protein
VALPFTTYEADVPPVAAVVATELKVRAASGLTTVPPVGGNKVPVPRAFADFDTRVVDDATTFDELTVASGVLSVVVVTDDPTPDDLSGVTRNK